MQCLALNALSPVPPRSRRWVPHGARAPPPGGEGALQLGEVPHSMKRSIARLLIATVAAVSLLTTFGGTAFAQAGHFVGTPVCTDEGTTAECTGKVAGLGGTTFEITV